MRHQASNQPSTPVQADFEKKHLDLGCGGKPRNPYGQPKVCGIDLSARVLDQGMEIRHANLSVEPIPYPDSYFESVSAYDFLEHVPRVLPTHDGKSTRFPFIELMNEVWRVLVPGGLFYALTPAYPHAAAFQDPTHVNIITSQSHTYFTRPELLGRMYGYCGDFEVIRVIRVRPEFDYEPMYPDWNRRRRLKRRERRGDASHLVWEFRSVK